MNDNSIVPIFRMSLYRKEEILIFEPADYVTKVRISMVATSLILGFITLGYLLLQLNNYWSNFKPSFLHKFFLPPLLLFNIVFHTSHYAHNIYDPVAYFEPRKLYKKRIFAEMEITFLFNFPVSILFIEATRRMIIFCTKNQSASWKTMIITCTYSLMSIISGAHYTYEPPKHFNILSNFTIAGEAVMALILLIYTLISHVYTMKQTDINRYRVLKSRKDKKKTNKMLNEKSSDMELSQSPDI